MKKRGRTPHVVTLGPQQKWWHRSERCILCCQGPKGRNLDYGNRNLTVIHKEKVTFLAHTLENMREIVGRYSKGCKERANRRGRQVEHQKRDLPDATVERKCSSKLNDSGSACRHLPICAPLACCHLIASYSDQHCSASFDIVLLVNLHLNRLGTHRKYSTACCAGLVSLHLARFGLSLQLLPHRTSTIAAISHEVSLSAHHVAQSNPQ
jgi:hypothetical protein